MIKSSSNILYLRVSVKNTITFRDFNFNETHFIFSELFNTKTFLTFKEYFSDTSTS